jgi:hypothetical protein
MRGGEARQHLRQVAQRVVVRRAEAHRPLHRRRAEGAPDAVVQRQQFARLAEQPLAVDGRAHGAAAAPLQERLAEQPFEPLHLHGHGRLRAADEVRGAREAALLGDQHEGTEQVRIQSGGHGHGHQDR